MSYTIIIRKNSTGEIRTLPEDKHEWDDASDYSWTEGNYGCDCNRGLYFMWAAGEDTSNYDHECGITEFSCWAKLADGKIIELDDDAEEGGPPTLSSNPPDACTAPSLPGTE